MVETDETHETDIGLDRHIKDGQNVPEKTEDEHETITMTSPKEKENAPQSNDNVSQPSHPSQPEKAKVKHQAYRMSNGDWGCNNCSFKGDRFDMNDTSCSGKGKK